jgi:hypothetical protein
MILMLANPFRRPLEGVALKIETFLGFEMATQSECHLGPKKSRLSGPTPFNGPSNGFAPHQNH